MQRILLKLSGEALAGEKKTGYDEATVTKVALQVKELIDSGELGEIMNIQTTERVGAFHSSVAFLRQERTSAKTGAAKKEANTVRSSGASYNF